MSNPVINGLAPDVARHDTEYTFLLDKFLARPGGVEEIDGYRERGHATDYQVVRTYKVPWSAYRSFRQWALGFSYSEAAPGAPVLVVTTFAGEQDTLPVGDGDDSTYEPPDVIRLHRVVPAQDPQDWFLFCSAFELVKGEGAWVADPRSVVLDPLTLLPLLDEDGNEVLTGAIAYVDNAYSATALRASVYDIGDLPGDELHDPPRAGDQIIPGPMVDPELAKGAPPGGDVSGRPGGPMLADGTPIEPTYNDGFAICRLTYTPRDYAILTDAQMAGRNYELRRYVSRSEEPALYGLPLARLVQGGALQLRFAEGPFAGQVVPEAGVKQFATATLVYTWHEVPDLPRRVMWDTLGHINATPFDGFAGYPLWPAGTLLCLPWRVRRGTGASGRVCWTVQFRFMYRPDGWNKLPASDGKLYLATFTNNAAGDPNGDPIYPKSELANLFTIVPPERYL